MRAADLFLQPARQYRTSINPPYKNKDIISILGTLLILIILPLIIIASLQARPYTPSAEETTTDIPSLTITPGESCSSTSFDLELKISQVEDLAGIELKLNYDSSPLKVTSADPTVFLDPGGSEGSLFNLSDPTPDTDGTYEVLVIDFGPPNSGLGTLVKFTLGILSTTGTTNVSISDVLLLDGNGQAIGDTNGDNLYDGTLPSVTIDLSNPCSDVRAKSLMVFGPAPLGIGSPQGRYMWVISEVENLRDNPVLVEANVSFTPVDQPPTGCTHETVPIEPYLDPDGRFWLLSNEEKWILLRTYWVCGETASPGIFPLEIELSLTTPEAIEEDLSNNFQTRIKSLLLE